MDAPADEAAAEAAAAEDEDEDPAVALKKELRLKPGEWYVIHSYAGYENKVKANLETRVQNLDVGDYIFQVEVPTEEVTEIKNGQRKQVNRKVLPGYILVRMELNDESWGAVRNTPGVTGFVGATSRPSPLTLDDVVKFLLPQGQRQEGRQEHLRCGRVVRGQPGTAGDRGRFRGRRVGHRHGRPVRDAARLDQRGQRRTAEAQGAGVHLRPRDTRRTDLQPGRQDLAIRRRALSATHAETQNERGTHTMAPKKKVTGLIKLQIQAGQANPAPPVGPALGQHGVNIMEFCKAYNAATENQRGNVIPVEITVYEDRSFTFSLKTPPAAKLLLKAAGVQKGSGSRTPPRSPR